MPRDLLEGITHFDRRRFESFLERGSNDECWYWYGIRAHPSNGTPQFAFTPYGGKGRIVTVSHVLYDEEIGLPEEGEYFRMNALCDKQANCVNPYHKRLSIRTFKKKKQKKSPSRQRSTCHRGHDLKDPSNRRKDGSCKICNRIWQRTYRERLKKEDPEKFAKMYGHNKDKDINERALELLKQF